MTYFWVVALEKCHTFVVFHSQYLCALKASTWISNQSFSMAERPFRFQLFCQKISFRGIRKNIENACIYFLPQGRKHSRLTCAKIVYISLLCVGRPGCLNLVPVFVFWFSGPVASWRIWPTEDYTPLSRSLWRDCNFRLGILSYRLHRNQPTPSTRSSPISPISLVYLNYLQNVVLFVFV